MILSDYVSQKVASMGIKHVFMVTGGGSMHLNRYLGTNKDLECIFNHHEQACSMAAESYFRLTNRIALVNVTSGPGGTNAITGVHGAFTDSIGMLVISGQVKLETCSATYTSPLRQLGDQEIDIQKVVSSITKYSVMVTNPNEIRYHLEKAFYLANNGRPGPCWIDIPVDIQGAKIDEDNLIGFSPEEVVEKWKEIDLGYACSSIVRAIHNSKRPLFLVGTGIRLSGTEKILLEILEKFEIPIVTAWNAHDLICDSHSLYVGRPGTVGDRAGNFAVQNSDLLIILGCRLNIRQVSYNWKMFAKNAYKIWVDIDKDEMQKPTIQADYEVHADLAELLPRLLAHPYKKINFPFKDWIDWCLERKKLYPVVLKEYFNGELINPYQFMDILFKKIPEEQITVTANGSAAVMSFQAAEIKLGQRLWSNSGSASMGYDLPAAIGACIGSERKQIICLAGEGSIMMNLQELQTISSMSLPIKVFVINNGGYLSIFQSQRNFGGVEVGASVESGVSFPDFSKLASSFGMKYKKISDPKKISNEIEVFLDAKGPAICEVIVDSNQNFSPKLSAKQLPDGTIISPSLEDMSPFLSKDELEKNMINSSR